MSNSESADPIQSAADAARAELTHVTQAETENLKLLGPISPDEANTLATVPVVRGESGPGIMPESEAQKSIINRIGATGVAGEVIVVEGSNEDGPGLITGAAHDFATPISQIEYTDESGATRITNDHLPSPEDALKTLQK